MLLPFDYNLLILVIEHAYMVCPGTFIVLFWKLKGTSVYWPWSKGIHSSKAKSPNWQWLPTSKTNFLGFVGSLGTKTIDFWFARAIPWPTTRPSVHTWWCEWLCRLPDLLASTPPQLVSEDVFQDESGHRASRDWLAHIFHMLLHFPTNRVVHLFKEHVDDFIVVVKLVLT